MCRNYLALAIGLISVWFSSCKEEEPTPEPKTYFTLNVEENYTPDSVIGDNWIILQDENGVIWNYTLFEAGQRIVFDSIAAPENFSITFLEVSEITGFARMKTYLNIQSGEEWSLSPPPNENPGESIGQLNVTIADSNLGNPPNSQLSTNSRRFYNFQQSFDFNTTIFSKYRDYLLFVTDQEGKPLYKLLKNAEAGDFLFSLADFNAFDKEIDVTFPATTQFFFASRGYAAGQQFDPFVGFVSSIYYGGYNIVEPQSIVKLGSLDEFSSYYVVGNGSYTTYTLGYEYYGPAPASINLIDDFDVAVVDRSFSNYTVSGEGYSHFTSSWRVNATLNLQLQFYWYVYAPNGDYKRYMPVPVEIAEKYPFINFNVIEYRSTTFYKGNKGYEDEINQMFKGELAKPFEQFYKEIY